MNASSAQAGAGGEKSGVPWWGWALLAGVVCVAAISNQSLWIDEALTAAKASATDLPGWWQAMLADRASDLQMPLYMIYIWGFAKLFGTGEWALRMANAPWFVAGATAFISAWPGRRKALLAPVIFTCPFAWYYLDEARPYAMQLGASLMIFAAVFRLSQNENLFSAQERRWLAAFFCGLILLSGSSLLGMIWAGGACLSLRVIFPRKKLETLGRTHWLTCGLAGVVLGAIAIYYLWTLKLGARASDVGRTDARNVGFIAYELLGFSGLGPGRLEIRADGLRAFAPYAIPLVLFGLLAFDLLIQGIWQAWRRLPGKTFIGLCVAIGAPMAIILAAGWTLHFRVLGRHFMPLLTVILALLWLGVEARWTCRRWVFKMLAGGFVVLSLASCLSYRWLGRHAKDDYRAAAKFANAALQSGQVVWWNADREGAVYYQVPLAENSPEKNCAVWLMNPTSAMLAALPAPDVIVASKPDVYDGRGAFGEYLRASHYTKLKELTAFIIWQRSGGRAEARASRPAANLIE